MATAFEAGVLVGLLIGEGHFGGDGRQPQVTLRMHVAHESLFRWLERTFPGSRLYGPYAHGGRRYYQWMARGAFLREVLVPLLDRALHPDLDARAYLRYQAMKARYGLGAASPDDAAQVRHRVVAAAAHGGAAQQPGQRQTAAPPQTVPGDRLVAVLRAGGLVAAHGRQRRRDPALVRANGGEGETSHSS